MVKISVIIPVYNVEDYLEETIESLLNQTVIDDIEVLMIDDGSTDDSRFLIEKYALDYDNFHAYHKQNEGQGATRNYGLKLAKGEYVHFLDSDDYLAPDAYEKLLAIASKNNNKSDIVIGKVLRFRRYSTWDSILYKNSYRNIDHDIVNTNLNETQGIIWDTSASNKLYKREFLEKNDIKFIEEKTYYEDILFSLKSYLATDSISIICDVIYYWRVRREKSSTTQQLSNPKNFRDRLKVLDECLELMQEKNVSQEILNKQYHKWLVNDFKTFLKHINDYPSEVIPELLDGINRFLDIIPYDEMDINSYLKVLYKMVEDRDVDGLLGFAHLEKDLKLNPSVPHDLDDRYVKYIDFGKDCLKEELTAEVYEISNDDENIFLEFSEQINYISADNPHKSQAFLIYDGDEHALDVKDNVIALPVDLVRDKQHSIIKVIYEFGDYKFESILSNKRRNSVQFEDFDVDIGIGSHHILYIDICEKTNNPVEITGISFEDNEFTFTARSENKVSQMFIQNVIDFSRIYYDVEYVSDGKFTFTVPYENILKAVIKKWELNCKDSLNCIGLVDKHKFYTKTSSVFFTNARNKILITEDILNPVDGLNDANDKFEEVKAKYIRLLDERKVFKKKIKSLKEDIEELEEEVDSLNNRIDEFKSRKVVKFADKLNF